MPRTEYVDHPSRVSSGMGHAKSARLIGVGLLVFSLVAILSCSGSETFSGKCVGVADGDTITVLKKGKAVRIRLYGIDCPERGQDFYRAAKTFTSEHAYGKIVHVAPVDQDAYGRVVAWVSVNGTNLNKELVAAGLAWWYKRYAPNEKELANLEKKARREKVGIWSHPHPVPPWEFRQERH
jgi:micrococcal nuclease